MAYDLNGPSRLAEIFLNGTQLKLNTQVFSENGTTLGNDLIANLYYYDGKTHLIALNANNFSVITVDFIFNASISQVENRFGMKRVPFEIINSTTLNNSQTIMKVNLEPCEIGAWDLI